MKPRGNFYLLGFVALILTVGLGCSALSGTATAEPVNTTAATTSEATAGTTQGASSALVTFTDQNQYYEIQLPGDWAHTNGKDTNFYWDRFSAPDKNAFVENIAYDDGTVWTGSTNGKAALFLLNQVYSNTGKEGDIRVTDDSIQPDASERLSWKSKGGGYSGVSYFEVRKKTTFLMFTMVWNNDQQSTYIDTLNKVVASYKNPNP